jgi:hypothetical protein
MLLLADPIHRQQRGNVFMECPESCKAQTIL